MTGAGDDEDLLQAAVDSELDASAAAHFAERRRADPELEAAYQRLLNLRAGFGKYIGKDRPSAALRQRMEALVMDPEPAAVSEPATIKARRPMVRPSWLGLAAAVVIALGLGGSGTLFLHRSAPTDLSGTLVSDHMRGLLAETQVDVVSSDRHTVKPWFDQHLALSPVVADLSADGITLVGGRVDVIGGTPVPTLVYRLREHIISLTAVPASLGALPGAPISSRGYFVDSWRQGDLLYFAISDVEHDDLDKFVTAFKAAE